MSEPIIIALITAGATVVAALITQIGKKASANRKQTRIKQIAKNDNTTLIGIQNNYNGQKGEKLHGKHGK